jgi:hypothetical protein
MKVNANLSLPNVIFIILRIFGILLLFAEVVCVAQNCISLVLDDELVRSLP